MSFKTCFDIPMIEDEFIKHSAMDKENNCPLKLKQLVSQLSRM